LQPHCLQCVEVNTAVEQCVVLSFTWHDSVFMYVVRSFDAYHTSASISRC